MDNSLNRLNELANLIDEETDPDILVKYLDEMDDIIGKRDSELNNRHNETEAQ